MLGKFYDQLIQNFPQLAGYFFVACVVAFVVWKAAKFYFSTNRWTKEMPNLKITLDNIEKGFDKLNTLLLENSIISQSCYSSENSPRVINPLGERLYKESNAEKIFNKIKPELLNTLKEKKFDSLLELERTTLDLLLDKMDGPEFKEIQNFVFEHPTFEGNPLRYTDILFVMSIKLREAYKDNEPENYKKLDGTEG
jgi:hypothetical protein